MESARERKHGSRPQDWPLDHGTAFSVAAEKALGRRAAGPGRCLGATARGCARRQRAAAAAESGPGRPPPLFGCAEPAGRGELRGTASRGTRSPYGGSDPRVRPPESPSVFPAGFPTVGGPYARALPLRPAFDAQRGRVPRDPGGAPMSPGAPSECGPRWAGKLTTTCAGGRGGAGRRRGRGSRAREGERKRWREQLNPTSPRVQSRGRPLGEARVLQGSPRRWALVGPWRSLKREALFSAEDRMSS